MGRSVASRSLPCHPELIPRLKSPPRARYDGWPHHLRNPARRNPMRSPAAAMSLVALSFALTASCLSAQTAPPVPGSATAATPAAGGPAYLDPANWRTVKPVVTDNIVYATVPHIPNPSAEASSNPGTPNGIRPPLRNSGPPGTMDMHLDVYQVPSAKPTPVVIQIHGGGWIRGDRPSGSGSFGPFFAAGMSGVAVQYRNAIDAPAQ